MVIDGGMMIKTRKTERNQTSGGGGRSVVRCHVVHHMELPNTELDAPRLYASN